jgi:hypothetical protein
MEKVILIFLFSAFLTTPDPSKYNKAKSITGVWKVEQSAFRYPDSAWTVRSAPHESLYIFTEKYYSYSFVPGPRKLFQGDPNRPSDAEKVEAYNSFVSNTGTYSLKDSILILTSLLHKNPNEMRGESLTYRIKTENNKLHITVNDPPFLPGRELKTTLIRLE